MIAAKTGNAPISPILFVPLPIVERDDGMFAVGWHDGAAGPFESRAFAEAIACKSNRSNVEVLPR